MKKQPQPLLTHYADPELGELVWNEAGRTWEGQTELGGRTVKLVLIFDGGQPTPAKQRKLVAASRPLLPRVREAEAEWRQRAAQQLAHAVASQSKQAKLPQQAFVDSLELVSVSLHDCGELDYRSQEFFPGWRITIFFNTDLSFGAAEAYEWKG